MAHQARHDTLTGLANRQVFMETLELDGADHAVQLGERVLTRVREPISVGKQRIRLDASIGMTLAPVFADDGPRWVMSAAWVQAATDELLREADVGMYRAKGLGGGAIELHTTGSAPPPTPRLRAAGDSDA